MTIKRRPRKPRARYLRVEEAILASAAAGHPLSNRQLYYELLAAGVLEKKSQSNENLVSDISTNARRAGLVPWEYIVDETRTAGGVAWSFEPPPDIGAVVDLDVYGRHYECSISQFTDPPIHLEVWTETRGMAGAMRPVCERYGIGCTGAGGMSSATLHYEASRLIQASDGNHTPILLYIGDADAYGWRIQRFIEADLRETHGTRQYFCAGSRFQTKKPRKEAIRTRK